jgi:hypothetical protein
MTIRKAGNGLGSIQIQDNDEVIDVDSIFQALGISIENRAALGGDHIKSIRHSDLSALFETEARNTVAPRHRARAIANNNCEQGHGHQGGAQLMPPTNDATDRWLY